MKKYRWLMPILVALSFLAYTALYLRDTGESITDLQTMLFVWPVVGLIVIFGAIVCIQEIIKHKLESSTAEDDDKTPQKEYMPIFGRQVPISFAMLGMALIYTILMEHLGFVITSIILPILWMYLCGVRNWKTLIIIPAALTAMLYFGLERLLSIPLPEGILSGII